ncbi:MAG: flagellar hook-basal body complex protein [Bryobacteraceae bacterium]
MSGLQANSSAINMTANNLANIDTTGFKSQSASFSDLLASEMEVPGMTTALGTAQPAAMYEFQQGAVETGQAPLDAAISNNPNAFFVTGSAAGPVYTRAGGFQTGQDAAGNNVLLSQSGNVVEGYAIGANGQASATLGEIVLPTQHNAAATSQISVRANLDSSTTAGATTSYSQTIDDAQGGTHTLTLNFTKGTAAGSWTLTAQVDGQATPGSTTLQFDSSGNLTSPASFTIDANGQIISMPLVDVNGNGVLTQYASSSTLEQFGQNGTAGSAVTGYSIGDGGMVTASCADGSTMNVAQLAVAQVGNPETMTALGNGDYTVTTNTMGYKDLSTASGAAPYFGNALSTGTQITGSALEQSTTNMAGQLTNLMVYQQAYAANSKLLTTNDQMQQDLIQLVM